jgi:hypothetical protein
LLSTELTPPGEASPPVSFDLFFREQPPWANKRSTTAARTLYLIRDLLQNHRARGSTTYLLEFQG